MSQSQENTGPVAGGPFRRRLVINTLATGAGNLWAMIVTLASLPLVLHGLGATAFGLWAILQTFSAVTGWFSLADLGVGMAAIRSIAGAAARGDKDEARRSIGTTLVVFGVLGLAGAALLGAAGPAALPRLFHAPPRLVGALRVATAFTAAQIAADLFVEGAEACLEGLQRVDLSRAVDAYRRTAIAIGISAAALVTGSLAWVAAISLAATLGGVVVAVAVLVRQLGRRPATFDRLLARELLRSGRAIAVLRPLGVVQRTMDRVIVGIVLGPASVAVVEVATQVLNGADAVLSASSYALIPGSSWLHARQDGPQLRELFLRGTKYSVLATWMVCAAAAGLAGPFVHLWVGVRFLEAPTLIAIALAGEAIAAPCQVGSNLLLGTGRAKDILRAALVALAVNLVASVVLVRAVGVTGTFLGTLIGTFVLLPPLLGAAFDEVGTAVAVFWRRALAPATLPAAVILAVAWGSSRLPVGPETRLGLGVGACAAAGAAMVSAMKSLRGELAEIKANLRRRA